jgi:hypothetical protein
MNICAQIIVRFSSLYPLVKFIALVLYDEVWVQTFELIDIRVAELINSH